MSVRDRTGWYMPRIMDDVIEKRLRYSGAVSIEGPRGCGKTATAERICKSEILLENPDGNYSMRRLAEAAPGDVLEGMAPRLIDEWQHVPWLWDGVRSEIDRRAECGRFVLTSSFRPLDLRTFHTGTGRISPVRMGTMSLYETGDSTGEVSLEKLCGGEFAPFMKSRVSLDDVMRYIMRGGWPEAVTAGGDGYETPRRYLALVTDGYAAAGDGVRYSRGNIRLLLRSLALHEGTFSTTSVIAKDISGDLSRDAGPADRSAVNRVSAARYLDFLERLHITEETPAVLSFDGHVPRVGQRHDGVRRFCDVSLACAILGITPDGLKGDMDTFERLHESLCVHDLKVYAESFGAGVFCYRDYRGRRIDAVIELPDGRWCAFGTALGAGQLETECVRLSKTCAALEKEGVPQPSVMCVVCGLSNAGYRRGGDGVFVVPLTSLRP